MKRTFFPEKGEYFLALPHGGKIKINYRKREKKYKLFKILLFKKLK